MRLERGDRVIFTKDVGSILGLWPLARKGTEGTVTKARWGANVEVTLASGRKLTVSKNKVSKIGRKTSWW
jgi:hypothetical protein